MWIYYVESKYTGKRLRMIAVPTGEYNMDEKTLKALQGSIEKWEGIVAGTRINKGTEDCPLCDLFYNYSIDEDDDNKACEGCPVKERTGKPYCWGSPYHDYCYPDLTKLERVAAAIAEVEFLKSLLPEEPTKIKGEDLVLDNRTLRALKGSIAKWEGIVAGTKENYGPANCPLCTEFIKLGCQGCPIMEKTGKPYCMDTPYEIYEEEEPYPKNSEIQKQRAIAELEFLKSLLPEEDKSTLARGSEIENAFYENAFYELKAQEWGCEKEEAKRRIHWAFTHVSTRWPK